MRPPAEWVHGAQAMPHQAACAGCREAWRCSGCGRPLGRGVCAGGRCGACHLELCGSSSGHDYERATTVAGARARAHEQHSRGGG